MSARWAAAGGIFLPDTPNSYVERGMYEQGKATLERVRGGRTAETELEYNTIVVANEAIKGLEDPWRCIIRRRNLPQLSLAILSKPQPSSLPLLLFCCLSALPWQVSGCNSLHSCRLVLAS